MKRRITPSFLLALALLGAGETALRLFLPAEFIARFEGGFSPSAGFIERPDGTVRVVDAGGRRFHPQTFNRRRPPGVFRIFVLGDSVEYFGGDPEATLSNTYPARLGAELRARGIPAESFNLALTGAGSRRNKEVLRQVLNYQPSLVILKLNDSNEGAEEAGFHLSEGFKNWHPKNWLRKSFLIETLFVLKQDHLLFKLLPVQIWLPNIHPAAAGGRASPDVRNEGPFRQNVRESVALARARNIQLLLATQAYAGRNAAGQVTNVTDHGLAAFAEQLSGPGVSCFSFRQLFTPLPAQPVFMDTMHLTDAGDWMVARALADQIKP